MELFEGQEEGVLNWQNTSNQTKIMITLISWQTFFELNIFETAIKQLTSLPTEVRDQLVQLYAQSIDCVQLKIKIQLRYLLRKEFDQIVHSIKKDMKQFKDNVSLLICEQTSSQQTIVQMQDVLDKIDLFKKIESYIDKYYKLFKQQYKLKQFDQILLGRLVRTFLQMIHDILIQNLDTFSDIQQRQIIDLSARQFGNAGIVRILVGMYHIAYFKTKGNKDIINGEIALQQTGIQKSRDYLIQQKQSKGGSKKQKFPQHNQLLQLISKYYDQVN